MGLIISRFRRRKTTTEILETLETKIRRIEEDGQNKERIRKRIIGYIMAYSVGLYVLVAILYYYMYAGKSEYWVHWLMNISPLLVLPILVIFLRSTISWYYNWTISKNRIQLNRLRDDKKKIIEEVMNTETYKVAKEILDKYGNPESQMRALKPFVPTQNVPGNSPNAPPATPGQLRQRQLALTAASPNKNTPPLNSSTIVYKGPRLRSDQLPHPLLPKDRTALDKVVDFLLKDGPSHRMALICSECFSHNGMSMAEEYEYVCFVCAYCGHLNPARKQRPAAPPLMPARALPAPRRLMQDEDESSPCSSGSESDNEKKSSTVNNGLEREPDRPPSPVEGGPKSPEQKED